MSRKRTKVGLAVRASAIAFATSLLLGACGSSTGGNNDEASNGVKCDTKEDAPGVTDNQILLGASLPLTGSAAAHGLAIRAGQNAYYKMVNNNGGVKDHKIKFAALDDEYDAAKVVENLRQLVLNKKIFMAVGSESSAGTVAAAPVMSDLKVPWIAPYAGSKELGTMKFPYLFMAFPNYVTEFKVLASYIAEKRDINSVSLVTLGGGIGEDAENGLKQGLKKADHKVSVNVITEEPGTTNFGPIAAKLKKQDSDWVIMFMTNADTGGLLKAISRSGFDPHLAAWPGMADEAFISEFGDLADGMLVANPITAVTAETDAMKDFRSKYKEVTGKEPSQFSAMGWAMADLTVEGMKKADALTRSCVVAALQDMNDFDNGIFPPLSFGPKDRQGASAVEIDEIKKGVLVQVEPFVNDNDG